MKPNDIVQALQGRGWTAKVLKQSDLCQKSVEVQSTGLFKCVDGRKSDSDAMDGPKTLGGVYALVAARQDGDLGSLKEAVAEVEAAGFTPSVHGDGGGEMGCGFFKLWATGRLEGLAKPEYSAKEGRAAVESAGGVYETLEGAHFESCVLVNLVEDTTYEPQNDQSFVVDAWVVSRFKNVDIGAYLVRAAETVEKLNGPRVAKIIVPG